MVRFLSLCLVFRFSNMVLFFSSYITRLDFDMQDVRQKIAAVGCSCLLRVQAEGWLDQETRAGGHCHSQEQHATTFLCPRTVQ